MTLHLNQALKTEFEQCGLIKIPDLLPETAFSAAQQAVFNMAEQAGLRANNQWQFHHLPATTEPAAGSKLIKGVNKLSALKTLVTPELIQITEILAGESELVPMTALPQVLFTRPNATEWSVPHSIWHLDSPRLSDGESPGIQLFTFLTEVAPQGGGTLVITGSHRLLNDQGFIRSKDVKKRLKKAPYFADLMSKKSHLDRAQLTQFTGEVDGVEVNVVELTGKPGDVYLMDMRMLHTLSSNVLTEPRVMATQRFLSTSATTAFL